MRIVPTGALVGTVMFHRAWPKPSSAEAYEAGLADAAALRSTFAARLSTAGLVR